MNNINKNDAYWKRVRSLENNLRKVNYQKKCLEFRLKILKEGLDKISLDEIPFNKMTYELLKRKGFKTAADVHSIEDISNLVSELSYDDSVTVEGTIKHTIEVIDKTMELQEF